MISDARPLARALVLLLAWLVAPTDAHAGVRTARASVNEHAEAPASTNHRAKARASVNEHAEAPASTNHRAKARAPRASTNHRAEAPASTNHRAKAPSSTNHRAKARASIHEPRDADALAGLVSRPVPLHFPTPLRGARVPAALLGLAPGAPPALPVSEGPVIVGPLRGALVRVQASGALRLRARAPAGGDLSTPRLRRLQGEAGGSWLGIDEAPLQVSQGTWLLEQPPGAAGYWLISADRPLEIALEEVIERRGGDLIWDDRAAAILAWIDAGGPAPPLPAVAAAGELRRALEVDAEIAAALIRRSPDDDALRVATSAWRRASALQHLALARELRRAAFGPKIAPHDLDGTTEVRVDRVAAHRWRRREGPGRWILELEGPGLLVVDARLIGAGPDGALTIARDGRRLARADLRGAQTWSQGHGEEDMSIETGPMGHLEDPRDRGRTDAPRDAGGAAGDGRLVDRLRAVIGAPLGPRAELRVALAPGRHRYELGFVGREGALRVRSGIETPPLAAVLRGDTVAASARRARRALARSTSADAPLLHDLLESVAPHPRGASIDRAAGSPRLRRDPSTRPRGHTTPRGRPDTSTRADADVVVALAADLLRARDVDGAPEERRALARRLASAAARVRSPALAWEARAAGLEVLVGVDAPAIVRALAGARPDQAPTHVLGELARAIDGPPTRTRSPALALLDGARERHPLDPGVRAALGEHWRTHTRWASLHADAAAGDPWAWIEAVPTDRPRAPSPSGLWTWPIGQVRRVDARGRATAPDHPALLRVYVRVDDPAAPLALAIDGRRWHTRALQPLEILRAALPSGAHRVEIAGPSTARAWASMPPAPGRPVDAHLLRMWPLRRGEAVSFEVPGDDLPGYARVELRGLAPDLPGEARVRISSDVGPAREVDVALVATPLEVVPVDAPAAASARAVLIVPIDARARSLVVELITGARTLAVAASIRAPRDDAEAATLPAGPDARLAAERPLPDASRPPAEGPSPRLLPDASRPPAEAPSPRPLADGALAVIAGVSRRLVDRPGDPRLRIRRAGALLELAERGLARVDWERAIAGGVPATLEADARALALRLDDRDAPDTLDLRIDAPTLVSPALAAVVGDAPARLDPFVPAIKAAWEGGPAAGLARLHAIAGEGARLPTGPIAHALAATWLDAAGRRREAALRWVQVGAWQADLAAVDAFLAALDRRGSSADGAGLAHGVVDRLRSIVGTPALRRLRVVAAARSRWARVLGSERSGGSERLHVPPEGPLVSPEAALQRALLAAPWPDGEGALLGPGEATVLELRRPTIRPVLADLWCQALRPDLGDGAPARVELRVDGGVIEARRARPATVETLSTGRLSPGTHRVEVTLDAASRGHRCVARIREAGADAALASLRPTRWWVARAPEPVELVIVGPTSVAIEARAELHEGARALRLALGPEGGPLRDLAALALPDLADEAAVPEAPRALRPGQAATLVVPIAEAGPLRLRLAADRGVAYVRVRERLDGGDAPRRPASRELSSTDALLDSVHDAHAPRPATDARAPATDAPATDAPATDALLDSVHDAHATRPATDAHAPATDARVPATDALLDSVHDAHARAPATDAPATDAPATDAPATDAPATDASASDAVAPDTRALRDPPVAAAPASRRIGTFTGDVRVGSDDLEDADDLRPRPGATLRLGHALELVPGRLWIASHVELRPRDATALTGGGGVALQAVLPRTGLRLQAAGVALAQAVGDGDAWSLRTSFHVDRPTWIARRLQLLPRLDVLQRLQSPAAGLDPGALIHPRVRQAYVGHHPFVLRPGVDLRIQPWRDARVIVGVEATPNSDLRTLDHVSAQAGIYGVLAAPRRLVPEFFLEEQVSYRLVDADRTQAFLRSRLRAGLGLGLWASTDVRVVVGVADTLFTSTRFPPRNVAEVWLRVDLVFGRKLRDFGPLGLTFRPVREGRLWYPDRRTP